MPGDLHNANNEKAIKKLKQAQLPFKVLSPATAASTSSVSKGHPVKKRPFTKDELSNTKAAHPKKAKTSASDDECVEVSSSSDEPRATSPRRRSRARLDQFVRVEPPVSEVSTSCDLVDLTGENKENRAELPPRDAKICEVSEVAKDNWNAGEDAEMTGVEASGDTKTEKSMTKEDCESEVIKQSCSNKEKAVCPKKTKTDDDVPERNLTESGAKIVGSEKCENICTDDGASEAKTDKPGASETDAASGSGTVKTKPDDNPGVSKAEDDKNTESQLTSPVKDTSVSISEPEGKSAAEEPSADACAAASTTVPKPTKDVNPAKTSEPSQGTENPAPADASESEQDGDADDESADDVVMLDETKLKPTDARGADVTATGSTTPSTKRPCITKKRTPKQKERERIRAKREQEKQEEKRRREEEKERLRKEKQELKEKERKEKEEKREKERKEKEEKKEKERQEKEKEKLEKQKLKEAEKQKLIDEKRQAKEEEKNRKEEEKRKAEEEEQRKLQKAKSMFSSFFVKKPKEPEIEQEEQKDEDNKLFQEFRVKEDMVLAPGARTALSACQSSRLEGALASTARPPRDELYLAELRAGTRRPQTRSRTLPPLQKDLEIIEEEDDEDKELDGLAQNIVLSSASAASRKLRFKLLMFHENRRPAYWGTWSKRCRDITGRRPLGKAQVLNYEEDSDDDWEEEDPNGESLSSSEKEVESEDDYEVDNEYFVPHGYLSDEEIKDKEEMLSPEAQKARLKEKGEEFEKQMKKKTTALKPRLVGCVWQDDSNTDPMFQQLLKLLRPFAVRPLSSLPVPTVASGEVANTPLAGPSPSETPVSSAQTGPKFLKKFPDEALLPLARLVHGSTRGKPLLVREFAAFWKRRVHGGSPRKADPAAGPAAAPPQTPPSAADGAPTAVGTGGPLLSKKKIEDKLCDIAAYTRCTAEGPLQGRCCWMVRDDVLASLGVELPLPSQWKWITKTASRRSTEMVTPGESPTAAAAVSAAPETGAAAAAERPRPATSLITKFTKVVTAEEARSELLSPAPAKRKIVPTKLNSPQPPTVTVPVQPGISTFFKASPSAAGAGPSTSASAAGGTPKRRLAPTPVGPRPGPSSAAAAPARRLTPTPVSAGQPAPARRLTPTAVPSGPSAPRRLVPTDVTTRPTAKASSPSASASAPAPAGGQTKTSAPAPPKIPESAPRKITLISVPRGLPELAKAAVVPAAAEPMEVTPAAADVETITLD